MKMPWIIPHIPDTKMVDEKLIQGLEEEGSGLVHQRVAFALAQMDLR